MRAALTLAAAGLMAVASSGPALAQRDAPPARIGYLTASSQPIREAAFRDALERLGHTDGRTVVIEYRSANGSFDRLPALAAELVGLKVDVIVAVVTQAALAAKEATTTIPIVMVGVSDPVGTGLVKSLARPGGNITGTSSSAADVVGKQMELMREALPKVARITVLWNPANNVFQRQQLGEATAAAAKLKLTLQLVEASTPDGLDNAFATIAGQRPDAVLVLGDPMFGTHARRIAGLATRHRLRTVSGAREYAEAGILLTYGPSYDEAYRRAATFVDRIVKGARPADLPVERSTKFELVINTTTARAVGVTLPQAVVLRADEVLR